MKTKAAQTKKPAEVAEYLCIWCDTSFSFKSGELVCPNCGNQTGADLVAIYMENDPLEEALYCPVDFSGG